MPSYDLLALEQVGLQPSDLHDAQADAARASLRYVDTLIYADAVHEVCESFGSYGIDSTERETRLAYVGQMATKYLDFRQGKSRAEALAPNLTSWQDAALTNLGDQVGMTGLSMAVKKPAKALITHGAYGPGIYDRLLWTGQHVDLLTDRYPGEAPIVVGAASDRPVTDGDRRRPIAFAPYAHTERQIMNAGFEQVLKARRSKAESSFTSVTNFDLPDGVPGLTLSAPKVEGRQFPNTADTHLYTAKVLGAEALAGATIVGITTQVYVPFQEADMRRIFGLRYGADIQMAGYRDPAITQPHHIGQEYKAAIDQATKLYAAIKELEQQERVEQ